MLRAIRKIGDNHTKAHTVSELIPEASDEQHRIHDSEAQAVPSTEVSWERVPWVRQLGKGFALDIPAGYGSQ
jgi:hypothetical protein